MRFRARFAWWLMERISPWLDTPEPSDVELQAADRHAMAQDKYQRQLCEDAYWEGVSDARRDQ